MHILTVVGARPQFIKAAVVSRALVASGVRETLVHTGQHYDPNMSDTFFEQLGLRKPAANLGLGGGSHGKMTGRMLEALDLSIREHRPDAVLVYGDTNSTLAAALAAAKLHVPVAHVEAGLRSFDRQMPEEINRILTDQISTALYCPTKAAVDNLTRETIGFRQTGVRVHRTGDVMLDASRTFLEQAVKPRHTRFADGFILATLHRAENTDSSTRLSSIINALNEAHQIRQVVMPLHPRTARALKTISVPPNFSIIQPASYFEMLWMLQRCGLVLTDSGGVQKEAFFHHRACVTLRDTSEWVELVEAGANVLVNADLDLILAETVRNLDRTISDPHQLYGDGRSANFIADDLARGF